MYTRSIETQVRLSEDGQHIEGIGSIFNNVYFVPQEGFHETVKPTAFNRSLSTGRNIEVRYNHDRNHILASTELGSAKVWVDANGLNYRVKFNAADPDHQKVKAKIDSGIIKGSSFTFVPKKVSFSKDAEQRHIANLEDCDLYEVGPVNDPCNPQATASVRSAEIQQQYNNWIETQKRLEQFETLKRLFVS